MFINQLNVVTVQNRRNVPTEKYKMSAVAETIVLLVHLTLAQWEHTILIKDKILTRATVISVPGILLIVPTLGKTA